MLPPKPPHTTWQLFLHNRGSHIPVRIPAWLWPPQGPPQPHKSLAALMALKVPQPHNPTATPLWGLPPLYGASSPPSCPSPSHSRASPSPSTRLPQRQHTLAPGSPEAEAAMKRPVQILLKVQHQ